MGGRDSAFGRWKKDKNTDERQVLSGYQGGRAYRPCLKVCEPNKSNELNNPTKPDWFGKCIGNLAEGLLPVCPNSSISVGIIVAMVTYAIRQANLFLNELESVSLYGQHRTK
jgi:hypothetical protein